MEDSVSITRCAACGSRKGFILVHEYREFLPENHPKHQRVKHQEWQCKSCSHTVELSLSYRPDKTVDKTVVSVKCIGHWTVSNDEYMLRYRAKCNTVITGTRQELGARGTRCDACMEAHNSQQWVTKNVKPSPKRS